MRSSTWPRSASNTLELRFLEIMPMEGVGMVYDEGLVRTEETRRYSNRLWTAPPDRLPPVQPARLWQLPGARGTIGFISPVSRPFCQFCNRVRLTGRQTASCLLRNDEIDFRDAMRRGASDDDMSAHCAPVLAQTVGPWFGRGRSRIGRGMSQIGG